jgi:hypothetical protein
MKKLSNFFYRDSYIFGIAFAIANSLLTFIVFFPILSLIVKSSGWVGVNLFSSKYLLFCCIPNFIIFRHYLKELKMEKTGRAIFLVALIEVVALMILGNRSIF